MKATSNVARSSPRARADRQLRTNPQTVHFQRLFAQDQGVIVLVGYGIQVKVERGHLLLEDGIGSDRRRGRFPRVHHGLRRVVVIGADGFISLAAIEWLADQKISFAMLERDGSVLLNTGPLAATDTRMRRAQACAQHSPISIYIVRHLIDLKLTAQESLVRTKLQNAVRSYRKKVQASGGAGNLPYAAAILRKGRILDAAHFFNFFVFRGVGQKQGGLLYNPESSKRTTLHRTHWRAG